MQDTPGKWTIALAATLIALACAVMASGQARRSFVVPPASDASYVAAAQAVAALACHGVPGQWVRRSRGEWEYESAELRVVPAPAADIQRCSVSGLSVADIGNLRLSFLLLKKQVHSDQGIEALKPGTDYFDEMVRQNPSLMMGAGSTGSGSSIGSGTSLRSGGLRGGSLGGGGTSLPAAP